MIRPQLLSVLGALALSLAACTNTPENNEPVPPASAAHPLVELKTSKGLITLQLDAEKAPISTKNFVDYAKAGQYDGTIFHRVMPDFMIQGGGYTVEGSGQAMVLHEKPTRDAIQNEGQNGLRNVRGSVAMARKGDPDSATAQFFINHVDNASLDYPNPDGHGYAVFGKVVSGMDVVDAIAGVTTGSVAFYQNVPLEPIVIEKATVKE